MIAYLIHRGHKSFRNRGTVTGF